MTLPRHEATTAQLGALFPAVSPAPNGAHQVLIGTEIGGGLFCHDPFELYRIGALTNPNLVVLGQIGRGKSAFVKSFLYRQAAFGRRIAVIDPKGEYGPLARALGVEPVTLAPGGAIRINPLEVGTGRSGSGPKELLAAAAALGAAVLERPLRPGEHLALEIALEETSRVAVPTVPALIDALVEPPGGRASLSSGELREAGLDLALELRRFVFGELAGMFDGPTSDSIRLDSDVLVFDLSALHHSPALGAVIACAQAGITAMLERARSSQSILVVDEAWAVLANPSAARFLQGSFKLARSRGIANLLVVHRVSDLAASGAAGSIAERLAVGLLADCETVVCFAQAPAEVAVAGSAFGLSEHEQRLLPTLGRGVALWRVGRRRTVVEHRLSPLEAELVDTDEALLRR